MQQQFSSSYDTHDRHPFELTPWVIRLIAANAVVYLLRITVLTGSTLVDYFGFTPSVFIRQPWSAITYMFLHGGFMHLFFNMLVLFFFGPAVESKMGSRNFLRYYVLCGLGGAALSFIFAFESVPIIGASAAVFGVALAFAVNWPDARVFIFPFPIPIKVKWLVAFLVISTLIYARMGVQDGIAHFAHLGGLLFGAAYLLHERGYFGRLAAPRKRTSRPKVFVHPGARRASRSEKETAAVAEHRQEPPRTNEMYDEIDRVLDKISDKGIDSLSPAERKVLDDASKRMRGHDKH